ncbi:MAG: Sua5/YciO/YrdC/YwlC family protein [Bacteroidales bacterium]|nr:Sua5/YciO/YrdC/YwlC family protein [Bacteroidales bacterium]
MLILHSEMENIDNIVTLAAQALRAGKTLLYPTDTIWGLGCDAANAAAVEALYSLKRRDPGKSMLVLMLPEWAPADGEAAQMLRSTGRPTTVVLPVASLPIGDSLAHNLPAADGTVGVRIPWGSQFCLGLLRCFGRPIVSTSANFAGQPSPATRTNIDPELVKAVGYAVPDLDGVCGLGLGSRIIRLNSDGSLTTLRP